MKKRSVISYPHVAKRATDLFKASGLKARVLSNKLGLSDTSRLHNWIYGRSSPTLKECARLSILEKTLLKKKEPVETIFQEWIEATKPEENKKSRRGNAWLESQKLSQKKLDENFISTNENAKPAVDSTIITEYNSSRTLKMFQVARFIPYEIQTELSMRIAGHLADFFLATGVQVLNDDRTKSFIHAAAQFLLAGLEHRSAPTSSEQPRK